MISICGQISLDAKLPFQGGGLFCCGLPKALPLVRLTWAFSPLYWLFGCFRSVFRSYVLPLEPIRVRLGSVFWLVCRVLYLIENHDSLSG